MKLDEPQQVASMIGPLMSGFEGPWCVAGGWALDLFLGRATRPHNDIEFAVFREDQALLQEQFEGWTFTVSIRGRREPWLPGETLELPLHELHAYSPDEPRQTIEFLLNERDGTNWVFRRDPAIVRRLDHAIVDTDFGVRALAPEIVLLFKAKATRPKDEADYAAARGALSEERRLWLRTALQRFDPAHRWLPSLRSAIR